MSIIHKKSAAENFLSGTLFGMKNSSFYITHYLLLIPRQYLVDEAIIFGFVRPKPLVAVRV